MRQEEVDSGYLFAKLIQLLFDCGVVLRQDRTAAAGGQRYGETMDDERFHDVAPAGFGVSTISF